MNPETKQKESVRLVSSAPEQPSIDGFELLALIGSGGMGSVYKARQSSGDAVFAIKVLHPELARDPVNVRRFEQEAQACGKLDNPHVVNVYSCGTTGDGRPYLVMDYICGSGLNEILAEEGFVDQKRFIEIFSQVCEALKLAHGQGIIHRDLKPGNIMLLRNESSNDFVKVVDFGIARTLQQTAKDGPRVTQTGDLMGSPIYMSPEQCLGQKLDVRSDIYSLGVVMYEALTGKLPFEAENAVQVLLKQINDTPKPLGQVRPDFEFGRRIERLVLTSLEKRPDDRWQTIDEIINELKALEKNEPIGPASSTTPARPKTNHRNSQQQPRNLLRVAAVASVLMLAVSVGLSAFHQRPHNSTSSLPSAQALSPEQQAVAFLYAQKYTEAYKILQSEIDAAKREGEEAPELTSLCIKYADYMLSDVNVQKSPQFSDTYPSAMNGTIDMPHQGARTKYAETFLEEAEKFAVQANHNVLRLEIVKRRADLAHYLGDEDDYEKWLQQYIKIQDSTHAKPAMIFDAREQLARLYIKQGRPAAEIEPILLGALAREEDSGFHSYPGPHSELAQLYAKSKQYDKLDELCERMFKTDPGKYSWDFGPWIKSLRARGLTAKADEVRKVANAAWQKANPQQPMNPPED